MTLQASKCLLHFVSKLKKTIVFVFVFMISFSEHLFSRAQMPKQATSFQAQTFTAPA